MSGSILTLAFIKPDYDFSRYGSSQPFEHPQDGQAIDSLAQDQELTQTNKRIPAPSREHSSCPIFRNSASRHNRS
jgi:hypothetical protein